MPRPYCVRCGYPEQTCICKGISETCYQTRVVILQHPSETSHAKNTARLIKLVIPAAEIVVGETAADFGAVRDRFANDPAAVVLYPAPESLSLEDCAGGARIETLIIIDGTWRKAKKIWLGNPWLHAMRIAHLKIADDSAYAIRASSIDGGLASIEAAAYALQQLEETPTEPLWNAFMAMQKHWPR